MATYFVGPGGSDANSGLSWALRKLTLNGAEDVPVAAGDTVYVGPGVYRELLTVDVAGTSGNPITYIGDVTGENTDGIGGVVRVTGSNNDLTATRANCVNMPTTRSFRTFLGFLFDTGSGVLFLVQASSSNLIVEDCSFQAGSSTSSALLDINGTGTGHIIRRCLFLSALAYGLRFVHTATVNNAGHLVENCLFNANGSGSGMNVRTERVGGITVNNCSFVGGNDAVRVTTALAVGQTVTVNNCIISNQATGVTGTVTGEIVEDFNTFWANGTNRTNTAAGANSVGNPPLFEPLILRNDYRMPWRPFNLSEWSQVRHKAGTGESAEDFYGLDRPATSAIKSWGAIQAIETQRETTTTRTGGVSMKVPDAGRIQLFVPVTNVSTTFSVYVQREADYTGTLPQMVIRQPGVADVTVTDTGAVSVWNQLTTTLTPASTTDFVIVELVSNNSAISGAFDVFWDDLTVS